LPIRRLKKVLMERIRLQKLKREHEQYLHDTAPRQLKQVLGRYEESMPAKIDSLARKIQPRLVESPIGRTRYAEEELEQIEQLKRQIEETYGRMAEEHRRQIIAAALHMGGHGPPYEEIAKHIIEIAKRRGDI